MKIWSRLITACLALASTGVLAAPPAQGHLLRAERPVGSEYFVVLKQTPDRGRAGFAARADAMAKAYKGRVLQTYDFGFRGFLVSASEAQARAMAEDPQVEYVEENAYLESAGLQTSPPWGLDRIDQEFLPLSNTYQAEDAGDMNVYILDTGIRETHNEFEGRATTVFDAFPSDPPGDAIGHGTAVSSIIGGKTFGAAKKVHLNMVRITNSINQTTAQSLISGLQWVTQNAVTPAVVNLSFATGVPFQVLDDAVDAMLQQNPGLILVVAAGNSNKDVCQASPARLMPDESHPFRDRLITVGAIDRAQTRWTSGALGSNSGTCMDLWAPGAEIPVAGKDFDDSQGLGDGTSFAAPHVAGVAAIMLSNGVPVADVPALLVNDASQGQLVLNDPGAPSPNLLLFKRPHARLLTNGVGLSVSDVALGEKNFELDVPPGTASVVFSISGGTGDADLYVKQGKLPGAHLYDCRPLRVGNNETCTFTNPTPGAWFIMLHAFSTYTTTLKGQF